MKETLNNPLAEILSEISLLHKKFDAFTSQAKNNDVNIEQQNFIAELPDNLQTKHLKKIFGKSAVTFWHWQKQNLLRPQIIRGRKFYAKADVLALLNQKTSKKRA